MIHALRAVALLALPSLATAAPMQLLHQARLLDSSGAPVNGSHNLELRVLDGSDTARFSETFTAVDVENGYVAVTLGGSSTALDTAVFLDYGAMSLEILVDGASVGTSPLGGYPVQVAQQSLMALESSAQLLLARMEYSETCDDFASFGWDTRADCLRDGRWHLVYDQGGATGSLTDLLSVADAGASIRAVTNVNPASVDCVSTSRLDRAWSLGITGLACHSPITDHPGPHNLVNDTTYWSSYTVMTDGRIIYTEETQGTGGRFDGTWNSGVPVKWYARF